MRKPRAKRNAPWADVVEIGPATLYLGDCRAVMSALAEESPASMHACVTDPPYELGFMGKSWDKAGGVASDPATWQLVEALLRPGGHCVAFAGSRTYHRIATAIEAAGFEIRDMLMWLYGSGFPKSLDVAKAIDACDAKAETPEEVLKFTAWMRSTGITAAEINDATGSFMGSHYLTAGSQPAIPTADAFDAIRPLIGKKIPEWVEHAVAHRERRARAKSANLARREVIGQHATHAQARKWADSFDGSGVGEIGKITVAYTDEAKRWEGWGTALKPGHEPIALARKRFHGTVAGCVLAHGTAGLNIDATRVGWQSDADAASAAAAAAARRLTQDTPGRERWEGHGGAYQDPHRSHAAWEANADKGRWPANVVTDGSFDVLEALPHMAREAIRFFYAAKASKDEREYGLRDAPKTKRAGTFGDGIGGTPKVNGERPSARGNFHPTVKPVDLMAWLCRLITAPGGTVLEPFMGSGSTGIAAVRHGFRFVGIEQSPEYFDIARRRIAAAVEEAAHMPSMEAELAKAAYERRAARAGADLQTTMLFDKKSRDRATRPPNFGQDYLRRGLTVKANRIIESVKVAKPVTPASGNASAGFSFPTQDAAKGKHVRANARDARTRDPPTIAADLGTDQASNPLIRERAVSVSYHWENREALDKVIAASAVLAGPKKFTGLRRAVNHTGDKSYTQVRRAISKRTSIPPMALDRYGAMRKRLATDALLSYEIHATGKGIPYKVMGARQTRAGVTVMAWGKRFLIPHAFIGQGKLNGDVFIRRGAGRFPIKRLTGPSVPKELVKEYVEKLFVQTINTDLVPRVEHEIRLLTGGILA